ncbi:sugar diacid recognition domain-containing protein [Fictibacillus terranigra]|uniref:sugar diacid recognition domain-containing protein n=1 Tax=Fictibacillus terranigra TaxID=3058424 RepID=UPI00338E3137
MLDRLAQEIANTTSKVIDHDVLITDQNGIVLGSSDRSELAHYIKLPLMYWPQKH